MATDLTDRLESEEPAKWKDIAVTLIDMDNNTTNNLLSMGKLLNILIDEINAIKNALQRQHVLCDTDYTIDHPIFKKLYGDISILRRTVVNIADNMEDPNETIKEDQANVNLCTSQIDAVAGTTQYKQHEDKIRLTEDSAIVGDRHVTENLRVGDDDRPEVKEVGSGEGEECGVAESKRYNGGTNGKSSETVTPDGSSDGDTGGLGEVESKREHNINP
ncbi:MAG TPA: hypothetical protein VMV86_03135 [Methanosarcinales archaeon]|nr:hypothetical protein [Methanosarcinales archaeon]